MQARYADGRAAVLNPTQCELGADAVSFDTAAGRQVWLYADLRRTDDDNGLIILKLKRKPDPGERLILDEDARAALKAAAPALFKPQAQGVESPALVGGLAGAAVSLAAAFLIGVPVAAKPIARVMPAHYQEQVGTIARAQLEGMTEYCDGSPEAQSALNQLISRFVENSGDPDAAALRSSIHVTFVRAPFPNAFALPDNSIVITDQLIAAAESPDEIAGVLAHELAHITRHHVMANVIRNIGAGVFFDIVFGGAGLGQAAAIASVNLASLSYSRADESEADRVALDYLDAAEIDPGALARFFDRMAQLTGERADDARYPNLLSSHPATPERAAAARARAHVGLPALDAAQWNAVRSACGAPNGAPSPSVPGALKPGAAQPPLGKPGKPS